ncbi:MAG: LL-diaminopimelate aminotransferase [Clostridiales bacterium]|jgi:LL-diaminopimelate aminotransferase|nr:LL-diaminopimelate aminotransferase [Clostridiales bacterium]
MIRINENYLKLPGSYLFSEIAGRIRKYNENNPELDLIRLGIGDVTRPLAPSVVEALHRAVDDEAAAESFHGYGPEAGYEFLRSKISEEHYGRLGVKIAVDEIFVGDGAKSDTGNIGDIFAADSTVAVCDPVYPVYVDTNAMAGRAGNYRQADGRWSRLTYLPCTAENNFVPELPSAGEAAPELIYLCFPNNPTGSVITREQLGQWVDYARKNGSIILYDAAYEAYITEDLPHSIFEIEGARECAIEFCSFSKLAGFTGIRLGYTVIPRELKVDGTSLNSLWSRRQSTKFNGASYLTQRAGEAVFSVQGQKEVRETIAYYQANARTIYSGLSKLGWQVYGAVNAPYIWLKTPDNMGSWEFFDYLLEHAGIAGTPGSGFGPCGEGYFRLTAFGTAEKTEEAVARITTLVR